MNNPSVTNVTFETMTITPAMAEEFLAKNIHNRNTKHSNLTKVVRALENGEWVLNGEAIKIAADGAVLDGQHRLLGIVKTQISMETLVIRGLVKDSGYKRETVTGRKATVWVAS